MEEDDSFLCSSHEGSPGVFDMEGLMIQKASWKEQNQKDPQFEKGRNLQFMNSRLLRANSDDSLRSQSFENRDDILNYSLEEVKGYKFVHREGRPPWYDQEGTPQEPYIIGVCGGSASGKTTVCNSIIRKLNIPWVVVLSQDSFYKTPNPKEMENIGDYNFDHPNAIDFDLIVEVILNLKKGRSVEIPIYDFKTHQRSSQTKKLYGADVIIVEGILVFYSAELRKHMDMKIFVDTDSDIRLCRRLRRDIAERGRSLEDVINQYHKFVKPAFEDFILPTMQYADVIIPRGADNKVAINLIVDNISKNLNERGIGLNIWQAGSLDTIPSNVIVETNPQILAMLTILRNKDTPIGEYVFYTERISRLLLEKALNHLDWKRKVVTTPTGESYEGLELATHFCAVSIMRGGTCMEAALLQIYKGIQIGKILIQSDKKKNPRLFFVDLPSFSNSPHILLLEPTLATGATVKMAIRTLLDHGAQEEKIILVSIIAATHGLHSVTHTFPKVTILCAAVDTELDENGFIVPGIGNFGDRYFGT